MADLNGIDTTTSEGFRAGREHLGLSDGALGIVLGIDRRTIRRWENDLQPHPVAASMLRGLMAGYRPVEYPEHVTGDEFLQMIEDSGLDLQGAGELLDVDNEVISKWASDERGPTPIAVRALRWYQEGWRP